jgi:hypothetical protein
MMEIADLRDEGHQIRINASGYPRSFTAFSRRKTCKCHMAFILLAEWLVPFSTTHVSRIDLKRKRNVIDEFVRNDSGLFQFTQSLHLPRGNQNV